MKVYPKKYLGQHFLTDKNIAEKIVHALEPAATVDLLEIGPGTGVLSEIIENEGIWNARYAEVDADSVRYLTEVLKIDADRVVEGDFLKNNLGYYFPGKLSVIGNLPYNISSQIFFKVLAHKHQVQQVVCMIQKEVAERICAPHGNKTYGILSVLLQTFYHIDYLFTVHEHVFNPPPKVKSAVIRLRLKTGFQLYCNEQLLFKVVKTAFNQRRKTLRNSLKPLLNGVSTNEINIFNKRPEQLSVNEFADITNLVAELNVNP